MKYLILRPDMEHSRKVSQDISKCNRLNVLDCLTKK